MNKILTDYYNEEKIFDNVLAPLEKEFNRIVRVIAEFFSHSTRSYLYDWEYMEHGDSYYPQQIRNGIFPCYISVSCATKNSDYSYGFPVEFFDMTNDQIRDWIIKHA
jgi:hypothetical protein